MALRVLVVGGGVFGLTSALALRARGHDVTVANAGPIPHPLAASTDVSKVVRLEYGPDEMYMALMERAREGWLEWNTRWKAAGADPLYHESGVLMMSREAMAPGGFEYESHRLLLARGHTPERVDAAEIARRFPAWRNAAHTDGFFHRIGGYAESGRVVEALAAWAREAGVALEEGRTLTAEEIARTGAGSGAAHDAVVVAAGAWASKLVPSLGDAIRASGHPIFHLRPRRPERFAPDVFPVFTADVARTGYYGFPLNRDGVVKIGNHGAGVPIDPDAERAVGAAEHRKLRAFLEEALPDLTDAEIVYTRLCLYADTQDEDLWIARDPERPALTVAGGGSGHGFKFAPALGEIVADAVEGKPNGILARFRWRPELRLDRGREAARCHE